MGHQYSDFATYTHEPCENKKPHRPHENGTMYHENTCPGVEGPAREYSERMSSSMSNDMFDICPDCGASLIRPRWGDVFRWRNIHDAWHASMIE